jgi:peroxiredoxin
VCKSELRGLGAVNDSLEKKNGVLYGICVDSPAQNKDLVADEKLTFGILSDAKMSVIDALGLRHTGAGPGGNSIAVPAHFLIRKDGTIAWRYISPRAQDRPDPTEILAAIEAL